MYMFVLRSSRYSILLAKRKPLEEAKIVIDEKINKIKINSLQNINKCVFV